MGCKPSRRISQGIVRPWTKTENATTANDTTIPLTTNGIDLRTDVRFCTNGTC